MKKTENKGLMMIIGLFVCWIVGAMIYGAGYFLYMHFPFKILPYIIIPISFGMVFFMIIGNIREKRNKQKKIDSMVEELHDMFNN